MSLPLISRASRQDLESWSNHEDMNPTLKPQISQSKLRLLRVRPRYGCACRAALGRLQVPITACLLISSKTNLVHCFALLLYPSNFCAGARRISDYWTSFETVGVIVVTRKLTSRKSHVAEGCRGIHGPLSLTAWVMGLLAKLKPSDP